ncbi:MAG: contractile injection system protein, VgrG/Pvc8 family, partial [Ferruginibacter sp.]
MAFQLTHTKIRVEGNDEDIIFANLSVNQQLADVNTFHFTWRQPEGEANLSSHVSFYNDNLSKEVTITIADDFTFKGIIYAISCNNQDSLGVSYEVSGKGMFEKLNQMPECRSFYKKSITDIFNAVNNTSGTTLNLSPSNNKSLFYTVQYNQTALSFLRNLAARNGEWMYYTGTEMVLGAPSGDPVTLNPGEDVNDVDISAKMVIAPVNNSSFNRHSGEELSHEPQTNNAGGFIGAAQQAGAAAYGGNQSRTHMSAAVTQDLLTDMSTLSQKAAAANAVVVRGRSNNNALKLAGKIKLMDEAGNSAGEYIITELHHSCTADSNYQNQFVAVPAEVEVPPYT